MSEIKASPNERSDTGSSGKERQCGLGCVTQCDAMRDVNARLRESITREEAHDLCDDAAHNGEGHGLLEAARLADERAAAARVEAQYRASDELYSLGASLRALAASMGVDQ